MKRRGHHINRRMSQLANWTLDSDCAVAYSVFIRRHLVVDVFDKRYTHLCAVCAAESVADEMSFNLDLYLMVKCKRHACENAVFCNCSISTSRLTISSAPLSTPQSMLEYQSSSCAFPSSGSSTKSASGFSSRMSENCLLSVVQFVIVGVMFKKTLNPI